MKCPNCGNTEFNIRVDIGWCNDMVELRIKLENLPDAVAKEECALRCTKCHHSFQGIDFLWNYRKD